MTGRIAVKDGIYYAVINYKNDYGKYKSKWVSTGLVERGNKRNAQLFLKEQMDNFDAKNEPQIEPLTPLNDNDIIFIKYIDDYVKNKQKDLSPSVYKTYSYVVKVIKKYFGNKLKLKDITYKHIEDYYEYLKNERKIKNSSVKHHAIIMSPALRQAYRDDLIAKNPFEFIKKIKREKPSRSYYNKDELEELFKHTDSTQIGLVVRVASFYGFRRSEILGLKWQAVDLINKTISIQHKVLCVDKQVFCSDTLKTTSSNRTLPLLSEIEDLLVNRQKEIEKNRVKYGKCYNQKYLDYVFVDDVGNLLLPDYVSHKFNDIITKDKLKHIRFHDLRHSCASLLVANGIPIKQIQEWLGHANFGTTADIYSHLDFNSKKESANTLKDVFTFSSPEEQKEKPQAKVESFIDNFNDEELDRLAELLEKRKRKKEQDSEM